MTNPKKHLCEIYLANEMIPSEDILSESNDQIYYNPIKEEETDCEYRFKTEEEFLEEYNGNIEWRDLVQLHWDYGMDSFFGKDVGNRSLNHDENVVFRTGGWNISSGMITPNDIKNLKPRYMLSSEERNKRFIREDNLYESGDFIDVDGYNLNHNDNQAYPFATIDFKTEVGESGTKHSEMFMYGEPLNDFRNDYYVDPVEYEEKFGKEPSNPITYKEIEGFYEGEADFYEYFDDMYQDDIYEEVMEYDYIGRIWIKSKVITFWKYPENKKDLKKVVESLDKEVDVEMWDNGWKILIIMVKGVADTNITNKLVYSRDQGVESKDGEDLYEHTEKLIPLEDFETSLNPTEEELINHIQSPLKKQNKNIYSGIGSKKKIPGAYPNELPVETRNRLYNESMIPDYKSNIEKLGINTLLLMKDEFNEEGKEKLIDLLKIIGVNNTGAVSSWTESRSDACIIIVLSDITGQNNLEGNRDYSSGFEYVSRGSFKTDYPDVVYPSVMNLDEIIKYIKEKILYNPIQMYGPKRFVYEHLVIESDEWYPYRFKTEEEMIKDHGENWKNSRPFPGCGWNEGMNHLLGKNYPHNINLKTVKILPNMEDYSAGRYWGIHRNMLIDNKPDVPNYMKSKEERNKRFIRESNTNYNFRFKTEKEMIDEFGQSWRTLVSFTSSELMDYLLGTEVVVPESSINGDGDMKKGEAGKFEEPTGYWIINSKMLKKLTLKPNYMLSKEDRQKRFVREGNENYPYRFKTEEEFLEQYGENWRAEARQMVGEEREANWAAYGQMDYLLGQDYPFLESEITPQGESPHPRESRLDDWKISWYMLTPNKPQKPLYMLSKEERNKRFVRESNEWYPYRFKTMNEMEEDFGEGWADEHNFGECGWNPDMESLLGTDYPYKENEVKPDRDNPREDRLDDQNGQNWLIHWNMLTPNEPQKPNKPSYMLSAEERSKRFVRESNNYRFKTKEEMIDEFGIGWREVLGWNNRGNMDYLLGTPIELEVPDDYDDWNFELRNTNPATDWDIWSLTGGVITKNIDTKPRYMLSAEERNKRFICENNDIKKLGDF